MQERQVKQLEEEAKKEAARKERELKARLRQKQAEQDLRRRELMAALRALVVELRAVGVTDVEDSAKDRMSISEIESAISSMTRRKNDILSSKTKELTETIASRRRRTDYLARAIRVQETVVRTDSSAAAAGAGKSKIQEVEDKRLAALDAYVREQREALAKLARTKHARALFFRRQLVRAAPAIPAIVEWVRIRQETQWVQGLVS